MIVVESDPPQMYIDLDPNGDEHIKRAAIGGASDPQHMPINQGPISVSSRNELYNMVPSGLNMYIVAKCNFLADGPGSSTYTINIDKVHGIISATDEMYTHTSILSGSTWSDWSTVVNTINHVEGITLESIVDQSSYAPYKIEVVEAQFTAADSPDGSAVSRTTYSDLFAVIDTRYGVGDGSTTFNLPNLVAAFPEGRMVGEISDANPISHEAGLPLPSIKSSGSHTHTWNGYYGLSTTGDKYCQSRSRISSDPTDTVVNSSGSHTHSFNTDSIYGNSTTVQPKSVTFLYLIKY